MSNSINVLPPFQNQYNSYPNYISSTQEALKPTLVVQTKTPSKKERRHQFFSGVGVVAAGLGIFATGAALIAKFVFKKKISSLNEVIKLAKSFVSEDPTAGSEKMAKLVNATLEKLKANPKAKENASTLFSEIFGKVLDSSQNREKVLNFIQDVSTNPKAKNAISTMVQTAAESGLEATRANGGLLLRNLL